jgi:hypothetical protein
MEGYDWKITVKKFGILLIYTLVAGILTLKTENPYFMVAVPILGALQNYLKHSLGWDWL